MEQRELLITSRFTDVWCLDWSDWRPSWEMSCIIVDGGVIESQLESGEDGTELDLKPDMGHSHRIQE